MDANSVNCHSKGITAAQQAILELPFTLKEHLFDASNNLYLAKEAIRRRFSLIDPAWSQSSPVVVSQTSDLVVLAATITVCGSTRSATGVAIVNRWKKGEGGKKVEIEDYELARAERLAYKYADFDLLPRIAQQFNVGAYLKTPTIKSIKTEEALKAFLAKLPPPPFQHWATQGGRERVSAFLQSLGLDRDAVKSLIVPGKTLTRLTDTELTEAQVMERIARICFASAVPEAEQRTTT